MNGRERSWRRMQSLIIVWPILSLSKKSKWQKMKFTIIAVLAWCENSPKEAKSPQWEFSGFRIPKKNGKIQLVIDYQKINLQIEWSEYLLPIMEDLIRFIVDFMYATNLDVNIRYMSLPLDKTSKNILMLFMPFGLLKCLVLTWGISPARVIYQDQMPSLFTNMHHNDP